MRKTDEAFSRFLLYGMRIDAECAMPYRLPATGESRGRMLLREGMAPEEEAQLRLGMRLHTDYHGRRVFFYASRPLAEGIREGDLLGYEAEGVGRFLWRHGSETVRYRRLEAGSPERFAFWVIHPFVPFWMTLEGRSVLLHCGAVEIGGGAVLFVADYKAGKSTLVEALLRRGHALVADDVLPTFEEGERLFCLPAHPYCRPMRGRETLGEYHPRLARGRLPIRALYFLERGSPEEGVAIEPVRGIERFVGLKNHGIVYTFPGRLLEHNRHIEALANRLPVYRLRRPWGMEWMEETCGTMIRYLEEKG